MPFFTLEHVRKALDYIPAHTHPALMSLLAMLRSGVPTSDEPEDAIPFGSPVERRLMEDYFKPSGGPEARPYFLVFGPGGYGYSHWRDREYPGKTLQVQRDKRSLFRKSPKDNKRWTLASNLVEAIKNTPPKEVVGDVPVNVAHLTAWCHRDKDVASLENAVEDFVGEFRLRERGLIPEIFSTEVPSELSALQLAGESIDAGELLLLLQSLEPDKADEQTEEDLTISAAPSGAVAKVRTPAAPPGDWKIPLSDLGDLCGLEGLTEASTRALAALAAGMNVILTGPPGSGKTRLAECICSKAGFPCWTVPATDQWTTFETIGGYFPTPKDGEAGDRLDFLPGAVVDSIERGRCLIIDEINRADIDKAFGELFTLLSGNTVTLPYRRRSEEGRFRRVRLQVGSAVVEDEDADVIVVPDWWRIVGSMNDADKASLKRLSMAFVRRFAFIPIDLPAPAIYEAMIRAATAKTDATKSRTGDMDQLSAVLSELFTTKNGGLGGIGLPLGPAFPLSILRHADSEWRLDGSRSFEAVLASALELYVMPQLQGRPDLHDSAADLLRPLLSTRHEEFERHLAVWTGYVSG